MARPDTLRPTALVRVPHERAASSGAVLGGLSLLVAVWMGVTAPSVSPVAVPALTVQAAPVAGAAPVVTAAGQAAAASTPAAVPAPTPSAVTAVTPVGATSVVVSQAQAAPDRPTPADAAAPDAGGQFDRGGR